MGFGERLKKSRIAKGWTQAELGKMLNVADATINRYEKDLRRPDPEMLRQMADILGVSIDYLTGRTNRIKEQEHSYDSSSPEDPLADLPEEARRTIEDFKEYIIKKYRKK